MRQELERALVTQTQRAEEAQSAASELRELQTRYDAALELLGERTERVEELHQDIADMKALYKAQITELCAQLEALQRR